MEFETEIDGMKNSLQSLSESMSTAVYDAVKKANVDI